MIVTSLTSDNVINNSIEVLLLSIMSRRSWTLACRTSNIKLLIKWFFVELRYQRSWGWRWLSVSRDWNEVRVWTHVGHRWEIESSIDPSESLQKRVLESERSFTRVCTDTDAIVRINVKLRVMNGSISVVDERVIVILASRIPCIVTHSWSTTWAWSQC